MIARLCLPAAIAAALPRLAATALPREACGLLIGRGEGTVLVIDGLAPSRNLASGTDAFEIDTGLHLRLQRLTRAVVGVWHSHPLGAALPSARDAAGAWQEGLAWLITASDGTTAWLSRGEGRGFVSVPLDIA